VGAVQQSYSGSGNDLAHAARDWPPCAGWHRPCGFGGFGAGGAAGRRLRFADGPIAGSAPNRRGGAPPTAFSNRSTARRPHLVRQGWWAVRRTANQASQFFHRSRARGPAGVPPQPGCEAISRAPVIRGQHHHSALGFLLRPITRPTQRAPCPPFRREAARQGPPGATPSCGACFLTILGVLRTIAPRARIERVLARHDSMERPRCDWRPQPTPPVPSLLRGFRGGQA